MPAPPKTERGPPWRCDLKSGTVTHRDSGLTLHTLPAPPPADERERLRELTARGLSVRHRLTDAHGARAWIAWATADADRAIASMAPSMPGGLAQAARAADGIAADAARAWCYAQGKADADAARAAGMATGAPGNPARGMPVTRYRSPARRPPDKNRDP